jgi:STIMATE family
VSDTEHRVLPASAHASSVALRQLSRAVEAKHQCHTYTATTAVAHIRKHCLPDRWRLLQRVAVDGILTTPIRLRRHRPLCARHAELVLVMVLCPWLLNALQFWILDTVLMDTLHDATGYKRIDDDS